MSKLEEQRKGFGGGEEIKFICIIESCTEKMPVSMVTCK